MKGKLLLFLASCLLLTLSSVASHMAGGEITYKYIGNEKYVVTFKVYRDCRGGALYSPKFELLCVSTSKTLTLNSTLVSIREISITCVKAGKTCNPQNTTVTGTGFEEHTFIDTLDFNYSEKDFKNCCLLKIGMGQCCRSNRLTTGSANNDFWVSSNLELCKAPINSTPVFSYEPIFRYCCNQSSILSFCAIDTTDGDSISYSWVEPLQNWKSNVAWSGGKSYKSPISDYWPAGYDKNKGPNPNTNPPIGTYLDSEKGLILFTPTDCSEVTNLAVAVKEWRKDSGGKYIEIGEIIRDVILLVITCPDNNLPKIIGSDSYVFCEGVENTLELSTEDKIFIPSPPQKPNPQDTTSLNWNFSLKGGTFKHVSDTARLRIGKLTWTPPKGSASAKPYFVTFQVKDNACLSNGVSYKTIKLTVRPNINVIHKLEKLNDYTYVLNGDISDTNYKGMPIRIWQIFDSTGKLFINNSINHHLPLYYFVKGKNPGNTSDTIVFRRNGKYIISHSISAPGFCAKYFKDTIVVKNIKMNIFLDTGDTLVCRKTLVRFTPKISNGKPPFRYIWRIDGKLVSDTTSYFETISLDNNYNSVNYLVEVEVRDSSNQINSTSLFVRAAYDLPKFKASNDTIVCYAIELKTKAQPLTKYESIIKWQWTKDGVIVSTKDSLKTKIPGTYIAKAENNYGCISYDTIVFGNYPNTKPELLNGKYCQNKNELKQNEIFFSPSDLKVYSGMEWMVTKSLNDNFGVLNPVDSLMRDLDTSAGYDFNMVFGKSIVDLGTSKKDSLKFVLETIDTFKCQSKDTLTLVVLKSPEILTNTSQSHCRNDAIDLTKKITSNLPIKIVAENHTDYEVWPLEGEIAKGVIKQKYFKPEGGIYFIRLSSVNETCIAVDSIHLTISPNPIAAVNVDFIGDSVKFTDNSSYTTSRKWYVNSILKTTNTSFVLSKSAAHFVPIKLELKNLNCSNDTTFNIKTLAIPYFKNNLISIYPNPVNHYLTIETGERKHYQVKVLNVLGQIVLQKVIYLPEETLDVANFSNGVYTLEISDKDITSRLKFIKE